MTAPDDIRHGALVGGIVPDHPVQILSVERIGSQAVNLLPAYP